MKKYLFALALIWSAPAFAVEVCSLTLPYWDNNETILRIMCTNNSDSQVWRAGLIDDNFYPGYAKLRSDATKYLLERGYKAIDSTTFTK